MTKKYKVKLELEEAVARVATDQDCPSCKQHFFSSMSRDSHYTLYPTHKQAVPLQAAAEAVPQIRQTKTKKEKKP